MVKNKQNLSPEELLEEALVPEHEWPYRVPENWVWVRLEVCVYVCKEKKDEFYEEELKYIGLEHISSGGGIIGYDSANTLKSLKNVFKRGDILYGKLRPYLNKHGIALFDGVCSTDILVLNTSNIANSKYVNFLMDTNELIEYAVSNSKGINLPRISEGDLLLFPIPLPPLAEQQRIVNRIESLFEKMHQAKGLIQDALDSFENRKAAILHKAFSGELTRKWREENGVGMESWEEKKFEDFCYLNRGFDLPSSQRVQGEYYLVTSSGITDSHNNYKANAPGVVTGRSGTIGKVFYIDKDYWPLNTTLYSKKTYGNNVKYIYYYLMTFDLKKYSSSTAVPTLNRNNFSDAMVRVPSVDEQTEIVKILDRIINFENSASVLCELTDNIELMKKSILARAFRGELGTNDPEEESAMELLKSILADKIDTKQSITGKIQKEERKFAIVKEEINMSRTIIGVLHEYKSLTPEKLKALTGIKDIEDFYTELKNSVDTGEVVERREGDESYLEVNDAGR